MGGIIMKVFSYNIVKIEKGCFTVEYKTSKWGGLKIVNKTFKTYTKAQEWCITHLEKQL